MKLLIYVKIKNTATLEKQGSYIITACTSPATKHTDQWTRFR